jgi:hypothetical protein
MDDGVPTTCLNPTNCLFIQSYNSLSDDSSSGDDSDPPSFGWLKDRTTQSDVWFDDDDDDDGGRRSEVVLFINSRFRSSRTRGKRTTPTPASNHPAIEIEKGSLQKSRIDFFIMCAD